MSATDLTTVANFKTALNVSGSNDDAWIQQIITRTTAWIEQLTNRKLVARRYGSFSAPTTHPVTGVADEDYLYFDGDPHEVDEYRRAVHYLPQYPIQDNSVVAFELSVLNTRDENGDDWDSTQLLEGRDYVVDRQTGAIRLLADRFIRGIKNYRVKCAAGYQVQSDTPWVPYDLEELCVQMGALIYKDKKNLSQEAVGVWTRQFDTSKDDPFIAPILSAYTRTIFV
jgi:hypothetical protein